MKLKDIEKTLTRTQRLNRYKTILRKLPTKFPTLEPLSDKIRDCDLILLAEFEWTYFDAKIKDLHHDVYQNCHAVTAYNCIRDNALQYVYGLACIEEGWGTEYVFHSFAYHKKKNTIFEPTPLPRINYCGIIIEGEIREKYISEELGNIRRIGLTI